MFVSEPWKTPEAFLIFALNIGMFDRQKLAEEGGGGGVGEWRLRLSEVIVILQNLVVAIKLQLRITSQMCHFALSGKCERWKTPTVLKLLSKKHLGVFRNLMCFAH